MSVHKISKAVARMEWSEIRGPRGRPAVLFKGAWQNRSRFAALGH
jgi:hypothetical protein